MLRDHEVIFPQKFPTFILNIRKRRPPTARARGTTHVLRLCLPHASPHPLHCPLWSSHMRPLLLALLAFALTACMHLKGVVVEDLPGGIGSRPMKTAVLSIGRPNGIAVYGTQHVDEKGHFDFYIGPT